VGSGKRTYKLPKIEIKKFNGTLTEWLSFWSQFKKIDEDADLHSSDKFQYLVQAMVPGSRARELVDSYPQTAENYAKVIAALKERFGKEKLLKQVYVRELLKMVLNNAKKQDKVQLSRMFDQLESHLRSLESLGVTIEQMTEFLYPMVESSLPEEILIAWQRSPMYGRDGNLEIPPKSDLDYLMLFLKQEVQSEELRQLARSGFNSSCSITEKKKTNQFKQKGAWGEDDLPTAAGLFTGKVMNCIFCQNAHESKDCRKAQSLTLEEKRNRVKSNGGCFVCLKSGHTAAKCKVFVKCKVCQKKHMTIMCPNSEEKKPYSQTFEPTTDQVSKTVSSAMNCTNEV